MIAVHAYVGDLNLVGGTPEYSEAFTAVRRNGSSEPMRLVGRVSRRAHSGTDQLGPEETDIEARAHEILLLWKMSWNSSDGIKLLPVTLLFAKRIGEVMTELSHNVAPNHFDSTPNSQ